MPKYSVADLPYSYEKISDDDKGKVIDDLMNLYSKKVYLLAYSYVKDQGLAEDISQEVFIKCYKSLNQFRGESQVSSWIYRITANTAKDYLRSKSFNILKYPKSFFEGLTKRDTPEDVLLKQDQKEVVLQTVLSLSTKYREIIILYYFQEEKLETISDILNLNVNTVKTRLSRARAILKDKLISLTGGDLLGKKDLKVVKEYYHQHYYDEGISNRIKDGVFQQIHQKKRSSFGKRMIYVSSAALAALALFIGLAFYSPTVASVAAKVPFLKMLFESKSVLEVIREALDEKGYKYDGLGVSYHPKKEVTIDIKGSEEYVDKVRPDVTKIVKDILLSREADAYHIKVERAIDRTVEPTEQEKAEMKTFDQIIPIVDAVLKSYGHEHESIGAAVANKIIELELPKTETRVEEIKKQIQTKLTEEKLGTYSFKVRMYDPKKREREGRWMPIISTISDGVFGSKRFKVTGVGYTNRSTEYMMISINTSVSSKDPDYEKVVKDIETTIQEFLTSNETKAIIKDDAYKITIISKDKKETVITSK